MPDTVMALVVAAGFVMILALGAVVAALVYFAQVASRAQSQASRSIAELQEMTERLEKLVSRDRADPDGP